MIKRLVWAPPAQAHPKPVTWQVVPAGWEGGVVGCGSGIHIEQTVNCQILVMGFNIFFVQLYSITALSKVDVEKLHDTPWLGLVHVKHSLDWRSCLRLQQKPST